MGLFSRNYENAGAGIPKAPEQKRGFFKWGEIYLRHFWGIMAVNLIYCAFLLPIILGFYLYSSMNNEKLGLAAFFVCCAVTAVCIGPATCALTKICRKYSQERHVFILNDFKQGFNENFKQGFIMGIIDTVVVLVGSYDIYLYFAFSKSNSVYYVPLVLSISLLLFFFMMHFYIYLLISSTNLNMRQIIKNSFLLVSLGIKQSLSLLFIWVLTVLVTILWYPYTMLLALLVTFGFLAFTTGFMCFPVIRKYVIQPYYDSRGEENPEFDYLRSRGEDETLFEDRGGSETPIVKNNKGKSGKVIK